MKKALSLILAAALMSVGIAAFGTSVSADDTTISTADEYISFVNEANQGGADYKRGETVKITADLDFTGKEFAVLENVRFILDGDGHTLKGINVDAGKVGTGNYGLLAKGVTNNYANGTIKNLTIKDSTLKVESTAEVLPERWDHSAKPGVSVGAVAGWADRGRVGNNVTLENVTVEVTGLAYVGGLVGFKEWQAGDEDVVSVTYTGVKVNAPDAVFGLVVGASHKTGEGKIEKVAGTIAVKASNEVTGATVFGHVWEEPTPIADNAVSATITEYEAAANPTTPPATTGTTAGTTGSAPVTTPSTTGSAPVTTPGTSGTTGKAPVTTPATSSSSNAPTQSTPSTTAAPKTTGDSTPKDDGGSALPIIIAVVVVVVIGGVAAVLILKKKKA